MRRPVKRRMQFSLQAIDSRKSGSTPVILSPVVLDANPQNFYKAEQNTIMRCAESS